MRLSTLDKMYILSRYPKCLIIIDLGVYFTPYQSLLSLHFHYPFCYYYIYSNPSLLPAIIFTVLVTCGELQSKILNGKFQT